MNHSFKACFKNVLLRQVLEEDLERLRNWRNEKTNCLFLRKLPYISREKQLDWYSNYLSNQDELFFSIVEQYSLNRLVGSLAFYNFTVDSVEFGKFLIGDNDAHGKKIGVNSMFAALDFVFLSFNIKIVYLNVYKENTPALCVYKKVGFEFLDFLNRKEIKMKLTRERFYEVFNNEKY